MSSIEHLQKRRGSPKRGTPTQQAKCNHAYPILLLAADHGRRGFCLGCHSLGPIREGSRAAQIALIAICRGGLMEPKQIESGTRVWVQECHRRPTLEGLEGTIRQRFGGERYVAFEVRLDDGKRELFWPHELQEARGLKKGIS